jgi:hypothetical protein
MQEAHIYTIKDQFGYPLLINKAGLRLQPFWTNKTKAYNYIKQSGKQYQIIEISFQKFRTAWQEDLKRDNMSVRLDWDGSPASIRDMDIDSLICLLENQG